MEILERTAQLDMSMLKPGPENTLTGFSLEEARKFGQAVAATREVAFEEYKVKQNERARNILAWVVAWKDIGRKNGFMQDACFVTDIATTTSYVVLPASIRGVRKLGSYLLVVPTEKTKPVKFDNYSRK